MFSVFLHATLLALVVSASVVAAAPGLSLNVTGSDAVHGVENFKVVATLTNTGDETLKLLNDPRGALHTLPANTFVITASDGSSPSFTGMGVEYSLDDAARLTDPSAFIVLAPGQSVSVTHDLSSAYDFTGTGHRKYTVGACDLFHFIAVDNTISSLRAAVSSHVATLTGGTLAVARRGLSPVRGSVAKRAQFTGCSSSQQGALSGAASTAQSLTAGALVYLKDVVNGDASGQRYLTWFGEPTAARFLTVAQHFGNISASDFAEYTYDCTCTNTSSVGYVDRDELGVVNLCGGFWDLSTTGAESQAGELINAASMFDANGGCQTYASGPDDAHSLAQSNPDQAVMNADSHQYFAEDNE
ncbi:hypothetical protein V8D89_002237 [Ganoderma adspersum]